MTKSKPKSFLILLGLLAALLFTVEPVQAQWPPFRLSLSPAYQDGEILYDLKLVSRVDWSMTDVTIKIPLPAGTRFLEAEAEPGIASSFDGREITFFASVFHRPIKNAYFTVEVTDPAKTDFTTNAWITWKGDQPGDYLSDDVAIDITDQALDGLKPSRSSLQLEMAATVADNIVTYTLYPKNVSNRRMWDLRINIPLPEETIFLEAEAPPPFTANFDGRELSFFIVELPQDKEIDPLRFQLSIKDATAPFIETYAWAAWKNAGRGVGEKIVPQEELRSGNLVIQSHTTGQRLLADQIGDVPFSNYDLTSLALVNEGDTLRISFYTAGDLGAVGEPVDYTFYIDQDCRPETGVRRSAWGAEYQITYKRNNGRTFFRAWDPEKEGWAGSTPLNHLAQGRMVTIRLPYHLLENGRQFCWAGQVKNRTSEFQQRLPTEWIPDGRDVTLTQYQAIGPVVEVSPALPADTPHPTPAPTPAATTQAYLIEPGETWHYLKGYGEASYPLTDWRQPDYDPSGWFAGPAGLGYGDKDDATLLDDMQDNYLSVFMRRTFDLPEDGTPANALILEITYDDGFVAYLNGTEVARRNMGNPGDPVAYNTPATSSHEAGQPETIDLSDFINLLQPEANVLALQGHNDREHSSDFSLNPALRWEYLDTAPVSESTAQSESSAAGEINLSGTTPVYFGPADPAPASFPVSAPATGISGKLAVPIDTGRVLYDLHIFSLPDGQELAKIPNARQPNIRLDGRRMLVNHEGGGAENLYEYDFTDGSERQVSDAPRDSHPFYDPWGNRVVYDNPELTVGSEQDLSGHNESASSTAPGERKPFIFVQCSLQPPHLETEPRCREIATLGVLVPAGQMGEIQGSHPVWTATDMIAYKGCNTWAGSKLCGIYSVPSASTKGFSNGFIPRQLTQDPSDIPSDTKGNLIAFTSHRDGNWEAYVMNLDGTGLKNLSNSPNSNDGLPTISPDGSRIAFISDRDGPWAVWVVPVGEGSPEKLFDLPSQLPWGDGDRTWTNERISWGP